MFIPLRHERTVHQSHPNQSNNNIPTRRHATNFQPIYINTNLNCLPTSATKAHIVPSLSNSLLSIGQLCDNQCIAIFTEDKAHILHGEQAQHWLSSIPTNDIIMSGDRDTTDNLWHLPLNHQNTHSCNKLVTLSTISQRVAYYHACLDSPTYETWCAAIDAGHLSSFPALTSKQVRKHFPASLATPMGHLDQTYSGYNSTKTPTSHLQLMIVDKMEAPSTLHRIGTVYSDLTGKFIIPSSQGNKYILIVFDGNSNYIFAEPIPSRTSHQIVKAYDKIHNLLIERGISPTIHISDNEASDDFMLYLRRNKVNHQFVAAHQHRSNAAERAIRTFKNHFISTLCSCDPSFPLHLWDRLLEQTTITLNLLRTSSLNNRLSAYAQVHSTFDFNKTPIGPPGTKVIVHNKPSSRGTWSPHGDEAWYIGPAMNHYRNFTVYVPSTKTIRISDTLAWFPQHITMPTASSADIAMAAAYDLTQALLYPSSASALAPLSDSHRSALMQLATIFGTVTSQVDAPTEPRVDPIEPEANPTEPRVDHIEPTVNPIEARVDSNDPRVDFIEPRVDSIEPRVIYIQPRVDQPDTSHHTYNHNAPQRRRKAKHSRRHRNPISATPTQPLHK